MSLIYKQIKQKLKGYGWLLLLLPLMLLSGGCKKFLDKKPRISDIIPTTLDNLQGLLDNARQAMNSNSASGLSELVADNYYVTTDNWELYASVDFSLYQGETQSYIWGNFPHEYYWNSPYQNPIYYSNIVLDQLPLMKVNTGEDEKYNTLRGSALFYRAFTFQTLAQLFCKPYSTANANELGIVLRLTSNISVKSSRSTVQETYDRIIADLKEAANLLPSTTAFPTRPSKTAAYAALARTYLSMRDYVNAGQYANMALQQYSILMDYNTLVPAGSPPITTLNPEVIFHNTSQTYVFLYSSYDNSYVDSTLYQSYNANDLRKTVFFGANTGSEIGTYFFQGSYDGSYNVDGVFDGLATDELYLIRAECAARAGSKDAALSDLNALMVKRWRNDGTWTAFTATDAADALNKILIERRKELIWRGLRWSDIRRLNLEGANITLKRIIGATTYTLPPNDLRSVMLIPLSETKNNPSIQQNPR